MQDTSISNTPESLQVLYEYFRNGQFIVNRRYQRKLVWTQEEKISFMDSIYRKYSVPLILLATIKGSNGECKYEIIDGLQRLNALFSFIENEYGISIDGQTKYFNLETLATTKSLLDAGILEQHTPVIDRQVCIDIVSKYRMPISYITAEPKEIEEIFRRINAFGRQLSEQEIRQAGALGKFSDLVRKLSSEIRGDVTETEEIELSKMNNISLSNIRLPYGILINDVFWVKFHIIPTNNMRISRDEELIAHIVAYMIAGKDYLPRKSALDKLYLDNRIKVGETEVDIEDLIIRKGEKKLHDQFMYVFTVIRSTLEQSKKDFNYLIYNKAEGCHTFRAFQVIFIAIYEKMIRQHKQVKDYTLLAALLQNTVQYISGLNDKAWSYQDRDKSVDAIMGIIDNAFIPIQGNDVAYDDWTFEFENIMKKSQIEGTQYDFKTGLHSLVGGMLNNELVQKCVQILTGEVNKGPHTAGYVLIGITERKDIDAYKSHYAIRNINPYPGTELYITGVDNEIEKYYDSKPDNYIRYIKESILKSPVEAKVKQEIATNLRMFSYYGHSIILLKLQSNNEPIPYNENYYERYGNDTQKLESGVAVANLISRFAKIN